MVDLRYVLILLRVEKDRSAVAVDTGTVKCILICASLPLKTVLVIIQMTPLGG